MDTPDEEKVCPTGDDKLLLPDFSNFFSKIPMFILLQDFRIALFERKCGFYLIWSLADACQSLVMDFNAAASADCAHGSDPYIRLIAACCRCRDQQPTSSMDNLKGFMVASNFTKIYTIILMYCNDSLTPTS